MVCDCIENVGVGPKPQAAAAEIYDAVFRADVKAGDRPLELPAPDPFEINAPLVAPKIAAQRALGLANIADRLKLADMAI